MKVAMSAAHGGFGSERVPLGGGAAVFERLVSCPAFDFENLHLLGAGPRNPERGIYRQLGKLDRAPSELGMLEYARFCRDFGEATTRATLEMRPDVLVCHDISEGPDVTRLTREGIKVVTIFHVDVVDIFSRLYLGGVVPSPALAAGYRKLRALPWPLVLQLVFEKQQAVCEHGALSVVPSSGASDLLDRSYPRQAPILTLGWGAPSPRFGQVEIEEKKRELRARHDIPADSRILLTLSRLSPEKAQHRLLQAVGQAEEEGRAPADLTVVIAGAPAFMEGERHARRLRSLASRLKTRVVFPGHVGGLEKTAWYSSAVLFVVNSLHESYGLTTLEAMQQGCPVVAVRSFGTADTVDETVGRLVPPGPSLPRRLWGTVEYLLRPEFAVSLAAMSERARQRGADRTFEQAARTLAERLRILIKN